MMCCVFFFQILPNLHFILAPLTQPLYPDSVVVTYSDACGYLLTCTHLLPIIPARYMRTFDVIPEGNCV